MAAAADQRALLEQVTLIMVTHHSAHCLAPLAGALAALPHLIVVDNASADGTRAELARTLPQALVLASPSNLGFGGANNWALERVQTPYALLFNPDCALTEAAVLALMQAAQRWPEAALLVPQLLDARGRPTLNYGWPRHLWASSGPAADGPCCVGAACGAVMLLRLAALRPIGFFDTGFFLYYEDDDLCARLLAARLPIVLEPAIRIAHHSRGSTRSPTPWRSEYARGLHHAQSKLRYLAKYAGVPAAQRKRQRALVLALAALLLRLLLPAPRLVARALGRLAGLWRWRADGFVKAPEPHPAP